MIEVPDWAEQNVSRETLADLQQYADLLLKWNPKINLVSKSDAGDLWKRHIWDSVQVFEVSSPVSDWVDLGSGGGFPALVCAILAKRAQAKTHFTLIESDARKCAFLRTVARTLSLDVTVFAERVEKIDPIGAEIVSARALTALPDLLGYVARHISPTGAAILPKGENWEKEVDQALEIWNFQYQAIPSQTNPDAAILVIKDLARA